MTENKLYLHIKRKSGNEYHLFIDYFSIKHMKDEDNKKVINFIYYPSDSERRDNQFSNRIETLKLGIYIGEKLKILYQFPEK